MPTDTTDLVDVNAYGTGPASTLPIYDWGSVDPDVLATRRQLRAAGLCPGGHDPVAQLRCRKCLGLTRICTRMANLYRIDLALPKRVPPSRRRPRSTGRWPPGRPARAEWAHCHVLARDLVVPGRRVGQPSVFIEMSSACSSSDAAYKTRPSPLPCEWSAASSFSSACRSARPSGSPPKTSGWTERPYACI